MAYYSQPIASTSTMSTNSSPSSAQYYASSSMDVEEYYFNEDPNSVLSFETTKVVIDDENCTISFRLNKDLAESGEYDYKFLAFDSLNSDVFHEFKRDNPTKEWEKVFFSNSSGKHLKKQKVELGGEDIVLITGGITSEFTSIKIENFIVDTCFHGIFIFFNKEDKKYSSWIINYSHEGKTLESEFPIHDLRVGRDGELGRWIQEKPRFLLEAPMIRFYTTPYDDDTLGLIISVDVYTLLKKNSWNANLLTTEEINSSIKDVQIIKYKFKNKKKENILDDPSEKITLNRIDLNTSNNMGIVSYVARDGNFTQRRDYEYEFLITIEDPSRNKVEKMFEELKVIHENLFSIKSGKAGLDSAKKYFAEIISLAALWYDAYTSEDLGHRHVYTMNPDGSGTSLLACNPSAKEICHQHDLHTGIVTVAQSSCYPKCKDEYGTGGVPPHGHTLMSRGGLPRSFAFVHRLAEDASLTMAPENIDNVLFLLNKFLAVVEQEMTRRKDQYVDGTIKIAQNSKNKGTNVFFSEKASIKILATDDKEPLVVTAGAGESPIGLRHLSTTQVGNLLTTPLQQADSFITLAKPPLYQIKTFKEDISYAAIGSDTEYTELSKSPANFISTTIANTRYSKETAYSETFSSEEIVFEEAPSSFVGLEILTGYSTNKNLIGFEHVWEDIGLATIPDSGFNLVRIKNKEVITNKYFVLSNI